MAQTFIGAVEAGRILGMSADVVTFLAERGHLPARRAAGGVLEFPKDDLLEQARREGVDGGVRRSVAGGGKVSE